MSRILSAITVTLMFTACTATSEEELSRPDFNHIPHFDIVNLFTVSEFDGDNFFASISHVSTSSDSTIFVTDFLSKKIFLFNHSGDYKGFLGGEGEGPGEFRQIGTVSLLAPDTLQVLDWQLARITLFSKSEGEWNPVKYLDRPESIVDDESNLRYTFGNLYPHENGYLAQFNSSFSSVDTSSHSYSFYKKYDYKLNPIDNQKYQMHISSKPVIHRVPGRSVSVSPTPEGHRSLSSITDTAVRISTWTGENRIDISNVTGSDATSFKFPSERIPITDREKRELAEIRIPNPDNSMISRTDMIELIPDYKAFSNQLITDDKDRIWVLTNPFQEDDPEWLIYNKSGELLAAAKHPGGRFMQIKNNRAYISFTSADHEPAIGVYEITE